MACDIYYQNPSHFTAQVDQSVDAKKIDQLFSKYSNGQVFISLL
jgi:hypothetical protein